MEAKILKEKTNELLSRKEVEGELIFTGATPSLTELKKMLASNLKVSEDVVAPKQILNEFGSPHARFIAYVYDSKEMLAKIEPKKKEKKDDAAKPAEEKK